MKARARSERLISSLPPKMASYSCFTSPKSGAMRFLLDAFVREDTVVIVATIAFGVGFAIPDVRFVAARAGPRARTALGPEHRALFEALRARRREFPKEPGVCRLRHIPRHDPGGDGGAAAAHARGVRVAARSRREEARTLCGNIH